VKFLFSIFFFVFLVSSCSQFSKSPTSKAWHNMNAKYNALLMAKEEFKIANDIILAHHSDNFESVIPIFLKIDSTKLDTAKLYLDDVVKKTSLIAERHSNSKYLDDAYMILGKARLQKQEFFNAIETFKYLNTTSRSREVKNEALIWLMRSYIENDDLPTANQVAELLKNEKLSKKNTSLFLINKAYYHQINNEDALAVVFLEEGIKSLKKSKEKARLHFLVAQYYDKLAKATLARRHYKLCLKNKPAYELAFYSKMGLITNQSLAKNTGIEFEAMMADRKNQELLDKIYYKMGELDLKKNNFSSAISNFNQSIAKANQNSVQKAFAYKAIGDTYFDRLNDFETAATYYDSTLITIPKDFQGYKEINKRALSLNDFIRYKKALDLEDSLQSLAGLSTEALEAKIEKMIAEKKESQAKAEASKLKANSTISGSTGYSVGEKKWILYDKVELIKANNEFIRVWGNRKLADDWRRSEKESGSFSLKVERGLSPDSLLKTIVSSNNISKENEAERAEIEKIKTDLKQRIPASPIQLAASKRKQEESYFQLGRIYKLQFNENEKSKQTFLTLLEKFPTTSYEPEALYFLSLLEEKANNQYEIKLLQKYPYSTFARQIKKGTEKLSKDKENEAQKEYSIVFQSYQNGHFEEALSSLDKSLNEYMGSVIEDKMAMLRLLILAKISTKEQYLISLNDFIRSYPSSNLIPKARQLLAVIEK
jgi:outer membrane protein assembly factor BamD (BamD/ComL family)